MCFFKTYNELRNYCLSIYHEIAGWHGRTIPLQYALTSNDTSKEKTMETNKDMGRMMNHYLYGVGCPVGVSYTRWAGIVKFFEKNFGTVPTEVF
jgi:hypothetical protein